MKILHSSDWHIGRSLHGRKRYEEFATFLDWLSQTIETEGVDALLVAGDVFDTTTPSNRAQELYYKFLGRVSTSCCRHVVVIAGNHDSATFLDAPKELLRMLNVHVVGAMTDPLDDEVIVLRKDEKPEAMICAVPYLRDRDIRTAEPGECIDDKNAKLVEGLKNHYTDVCAIAEQKRADFIRAGHGDIPIVAMGHLFTAGGRVADVNGALVEGEGKAAADSGMRSLYVGGELYVNKDVFPPSIDYLALGHLHVPQRVAQTDHMRYCGSPIPMTFNEANQEKQVVLVDFDGRTPTVQTLAVPCFQQLVRIKGSLDNIYAKIEELKSEGSSAWLEIKYTGNDIVSDLHEQLSAAVFGSAIEIRRTEVRGSKNSVMTTDFEGETLDDLNPSIVFQRLLDAHDVPDEEREELVASYNEIVRSIEDNDVNAE